MDLSATRRLVQSDLDAVDRLIVERLSSDVALIDRIGGYIVNSGGKRLRPLLVVLMARACRTGNDGHHLLAAIVELIHTATLLHDDVVDASELRRGRETANHIWGNEASVLVGDFLYTRSFQMMVELDRMNVMKTFARATNTIAAGEVLQLLNVHDPDVTEERYRDVIYRKTAALFEAGCGLAAEVAGCDERTCGAAAAYGRHLGIAFQLVDDALDYDGDAGVIGKNVGDDLAEGKPTLPLIRALSTCAKADRTLIREAVEAGGRERVEAVAAIIANTDAIPYTRDLAEQEAAAAREALAVIPASEWRNGLDELVGFATRRSF